VTLTEMIDTIASALGKTPAIERLPMQPGDVSRTYADVSRSREALGYDPHTAFDEGVRRFVEWYRADR
jgi:UDP-glucuronate 4-epimerase